MYVNKISFFLLISGHGINSVHTDVDLSIIYDVMRSKSGLLNPAAYIVSRE